ncbi:MAG: ATP-binding protein [Gemmatimonadaceae bacterium]
MTPARSFPTGIRKRLIFLVLASVFPFLLLIGIVARRHLLDQKPVAAAHAMARSRHVAEYLDDRLYRIEAIMVAVMNSVSAASDDREATDALLKGFTAKFPEDIARWTMFRGGRRLGESSPSDTSWPQPEHLRSLHRSKTTTPGVFVTEPLHVPGHGHVVHMLLPLASAGDDSVFLVAQIPLQSIQETLHPPDLPALPDGSTITVLSESGVVLAQSPDPKLWVGRKVSRSRPARTSGSRDRGTAEMVTDDGIERLIAFTRLRNVPWWVYAGIPMSVIYAQARSDFARALGYGGLALVLALVLAMWQASRIIAPIKRLSADAANLGTGNLSHRSEVGAPDEIGFLATTLNEMATTLEQQGAGLRESEERYRGLFDINPLPMWVLDPTSLAFLAVNRAAVAAYGYSEEEFLAMKASDIRPAEDVPALLRHLAATEGKSHRYVTRHRQKDGTIFQVEIDSGAIVFDGRPARLVVAHDVSERIRAEEALRDAESQLRQSQRLEAIGQLTGGIAHDFNNVLTAIGSYSDFLYESLEPGDARRLDIQEIRKAADRAAGLTKQLLAFSRSQILQPRVLNVNDSLAELESLLKRLLTADLQLVFVLDPEAGNVHADPGQLAQVVMNLAVNARDAMPDGGVLTIASRNEHVPVPAANAAAAAAAPSVRPGEYVVIEVSDTGVGMDGDTVQRIFEPFFTTKEPGKGTGLGLSTVYGIVDQSGGYIFCDSESGKGTTFTIRLPRVNQVVEPERARPERAVAGQRSEVVLVVEDEESVRRAARRILVKKGYTVLEASDGNDAVELLNTQPKVDMLLTDLVMPGMGGRELVRVLRDQGRSIPTLYMSGYTKDAVMRAELDPDIMVLEKPFSQEELASKVREVLDRNDRA